MATTSKYRAAGVADVFRAIAAERRHMNRTGGRIEDNPHSVEEWLELLEEEFGEAYTAFLDGSIPKVLSEVLQAVAVGIAMLEQHGVFERGDVDDGELDQQRIDGIRELAGDGGEIA